MPRIPVDVLIAVEDSDSFIGGQRNATLNREINTVDGTHKLTAGWTYNLPGNGSWSIEADGVVLDDDEALDVLEEKFENRESLTVYWTDPRGKSYEGDAILTNYPLEAPMDDVMTYSLTFEGQGKYRHANGDDGGSGES